MYLSKIYCIICNSNKINSNKINSNKINKLLCKYIFYKHNDKDKNSGCDENIV